MGFDGYAPYNESESSAVVVALLSAVAWIFFQACVVGVVFLELESAAFVFAPLAPFIGIPPPVCSVAGIGCEYVIGVASLELESAAAVLITLVASRGVVL